MPGVITFILVLSVLVVVHEFGHFIVAKLVGIRVEKFSIGFGPVLIGKKFGETEFAFSLLPLGGYVKMAGENPNESSGQPWEFNSKPLGQKFLVVFAGPFMNALLAFLFFSGIFMIGQPTLTSKIGKVMAQTPAEEAGILEGDRIAFVNGVAVSSWEDVLTQVQKDQESVTLRVEREGQMTDLSVRPRLQEAPGLFGKKRKIAFLGVAPSSEMVYVRSGFFEAVWLGAKRVWDMTGLIFYSLGLMVTGAMPFKDSMTGPIGIYFLTQHAAQMGAAYLLYFMGSLSVSLFVLNLLPVPVLDGGHILFMVIERLKGSPLKESVKERMTQGGLALLLMLMAFVIFQDINRFSIIQNIKNFFAP